MKEYRYSSYNEYINIKNLVTLKEIKLMFGSKDRYYEEFKSMNNVKSEIEDIADIRENEEVFGKL